MTANWGDMSLPWGDIEAGYTREEMQKTIDLRTKAIAQEVDPFAYSRHQTERRHKAALLRAFFFDHYDGNPPLLKQCKGCDRKDHPDITPPDHFIQADIGFCCRYCRLSDGRRHGGQCAENVPV
jgi:hypothetical protein